MFLPVVKFTSKAVFASHLVALSQSYKAGPAIGSGPFVAGVEVVRTRFVQVRTNWTKTPKLVLAKTFNEIE